MTSAVKALRLPPMPRISDIIRVYGLRARKQLSQNFILDLNVTDKIARSADVFDCHVVEVGPGPGSLTRSILKYGVRHLHAVEIDGRFLPSLEILRDASCGHMSIHHGDIRKLNIGSIIDNPIATAWDSEDVPNVRLVGNLPFNVSIALLLQWLQALSEQKGPWRFGRVPMSLVFQKEVGENMTAKVNSDLRSRLSIMTQNYCHVTNPMVLNSTVFTPEPKVHAWLMHFIPRQKFLIDAPFDVIEQVVKAVFSMRRKFIRRPLRRLFPENESLADDLLRRVNVDPTLRACQLDIHTFNLITTEFLKMCEEFDLSTHPLRVNKPERLVDTDIIT